jgi:hypothetical protein
MQGYLREPPYRPENAEIHPYLGFSSRFCMPVGCVSPQVFLPAN